MSLLSFSRPNHRLPRYIQRMTNNIIPGKDAPVDATIETITTILSKIALEVEETKWLNPTPDCWSVHLQAKNCSSLATNGKGSSKSACLASGLGEFIERLATNFFFADYYLEGACSNSGYCHYPDEIWFKPSTSESPFTNNQGASPLLTKELISFYNPESELTSHDLIENNSNLYHRGICALPFIDLMQGDKVYFPVSLLNNLYVSNGMAAGNSSDECTAQALAEIIERHVKKIIIREGIALPDVPRSYLKKYPKICAIQNALENHGLTISIKDGSLGGQFPVICVLLTDFTSGGVYAAFGSSLRFEVCVERTLTELLQGRTLDQLREFMPPSHSLLQVEEDSNIESHFINSEGLLAWRMFRDKPDFTFNPWDFSGSTREEVTRLQTIISNKGYSIYRAEYLHYSLYSCRIIVPGMSEIYPVDDLLYNNRNSGTRLREQLLQLPRLSHESLTDLTETIDSLGLTDQHLISELIGVIFPKKSAWHSLRLGELKAMILLAVGNKDDALQWCDWCINFGFLPLNRTRLYRLLQTLLSQDEQGESYDAYAQNLRLFYSDEEIDTARKTILQQISFPGLNFGSTWRDISYEHNQLLKIYENQKICKSNFLD